MRTLRMLINVIAVVIFSSIPAYAEIMERIIAIVNGDIITSSELNNIFEPIGKKIEESYNGPDKDKVIMENKLAVLNKLIDNTLIGQESKKSGIAVNDEEVTATINDVLSKRNMKMDELYYELAKENSSIEAYKKEVKDHLLRMKLLRREIKARVAVSEEEIGSYYIKNREAYEGKESVWIKQILILFPKDHDGNVKARLKAETGMIHKRLQDGEQFEALAAKYSQGPGAETGGDIGYIEKGSMLPAVESVAFNLKKDEISKVIESPLGFHIIKVIDKRGAGIKPIQSVREEIKTKLEGEKMDRQYEEWIKDLRNRSIIEIRL